MSYRKITTDTIVEAVIEGVEKKMIIEQLETELIHKEKEIKEQEEKLKSFRLQQYTCANCGDVFFFIDRKSVV